MEYFPDEKRIILSKRLNKLDVFVLDFVKTLKSYTEYVIVSGYVSILFGRSRATEDIDLLIPDMQKAVFGKLFKDLEQNGFECVNTSLVENAFDMWKKHAIRFSKKGSAIPNIEFKLIKTDLDRFSFKNKIKVKLAGRCLCISNLEMQIAYKLSLGSNKDLEDAKHLLKVFEEKLNKEQLLSFIEKLDVLSKFEIINKNDNRFRKT